MTASISSGREPARFTTASRRASTGGSARSLTQSSTPTSRRPSRTTRAWSTPDVSIARRMLKDRPNSIGTSDEREAAMGLAPGGETDPDRCPIVEHLGALGPLDDGDGIRRGLVQPGVDPGHSFETIEVVMLDWKAPRVTVMQDEGRAVHGAGDLERLGDSSDELRLSRPKLSLQGDHVTGLRRQPEPVSQRPGLVGGGGINGNGHSPLPGSGSTRRG